jgi:hypothetical protein
MDSHMIGPAETLPFDEALDRAATAFADSIADGLSGAVREALADPVVVAMMAADKVDRRSFETMLRQMGATLANAGPRPCLHC